VKAIVAHLRAKECEEKNRVVDLKSIKQVSGPKSAVDGEAMQAWQ
jgi:hypothetical protein